MKVISGSVLRGATLVVAVGAAACGDSGSEATPVTPQVIEETTFAAELGITLADMTKTASGMYIQTRAEGAGDQASAGSAVEVAYVGFLTNAAIFDSGTFPFTLGAGQAIPGFDEGVTGMKTGEQRLVVIPPALAYGNRGSGQIPPGSILIFELEVLSIN